MLPYSRRFRAAVAAQHSGMAARLPRPPLNRSSPMARPAPQPPQKPPAEAQAPKPAPQAPVFTDYASL
ncbi:hypothetical protein Z945_2222 [Sulfitobacter noctilucae]|nr:hypothetical protein Z945_2222 [Sulfitobacter noctilucae]